MSGAGPEPQPDAGSGSTHATAQAGCAGLYVSNIAFEEEPVHPVSPEDLLEAVEAWGPQTLLLSVKRRKRPLVVLRRPGSPAVAIAEPALLDLLEAGLGTDFMLAVSLTAASSLAVPEGTYERLEAYPEFQRITWVLRQHACGASPDAYVTDGAVYMPVGVHFRLVSTDSPGTAPAPGSAARVRAP